MLADDFGGLQKADYRYVQSIQGRRLMTGFKADRTSQKTAEADMPSDSATYVTVTPVSDKADILDLIGADVDFIRFDAVNPESGVVTFTNGQSMSFSEIDRVVPCFTPGTAIATPKGEVAVETLKPGDRVLTRDNGIQTIRWAGTKRLDFAQLKAAPQLRPIKIMAGALGDNMPETDMLVSPSHRMLIVSHQAELYFGQSEILVAAQHMLAMDGVAVDDQPYITYIHFMCDNHEIVLANGAWSESFQPADLTLKGFDSAQRDELFALFPELETAEGIAAYRAARRTLGRREAKLLFTG